VKIDETSLNTSESIKNFHPLATGWEDYVMVIGQTIQLSNA